MNPPPLRVRALGHAVVVLPTSGLFLFCLYMFTQDTRTWPAALIAGLTLNKVMQANTAVAAYARWKTGWDAMSPGTTTPKRSVKNFMAAIVGLSASLGLFAIYDARGPDAAIGIAIIAFGLFLLIALLAKLLLWSRRRRHRSVAKAMPVIVCVTKPLLPVPDLQSAHRRLPEHCLRILRPAS